MDSRELRAALTQLVRESVPALRAALWPVRARVMRVQESAGAESDTTPRYTVDVQILQADGSDDPSWPELQQLDMPQLWAGSDVGVWCPPEKGSFVRVAFEYGDRSRPYIETLLGTGGQAPNHPVGTLLVRAGDAVVSVRRTESGGEILVGAGKVTIQGATKVLVDSTAVHLGDEAGEPLVRLSDLSAVLASLQLTVNPATGMAGAPASYTPPQGTTKTRAS